MHLLREFSCLFIGFSMIDENARRLLHYSMKERISGFIDQGLTPERAEDEALRHFAILKRPRETGWPRHWAASLRALGVRILWIESYEETPELCADLHRAGGGVWEEVF